MLQKTRIEIVLTAFLFVFFMLCIQTVPVSAGSDEKTMVGTLSAQLDQENGTVTVMFVGYSEGSPVIIGPASWETTEKDFSNTTAEDIGKRLCGQDHTMKKVTKFSNTGKEIVAEIVIEKQKESIVVGR